MRLGGPTHRTFADPAGWLAELARLGYRAAYCPLGVDSDDASVRAYADAAARAGVVVAEVGAWSNPLEPDPARRAAAIEHCAKSLDLADRIGARCCVNIAGSRGPVWDGPDPLNLTRETFDMIVDTVRGIIDAARPSRTFYTLETMPWMYPDSPDSYLALIRAIDRPNFAVHLDPVNLISSPSRFFSNGELIRECFEKLGPWVRSCHAKDIALSGRLTVHLDEVRPGTGGLDYAAYLRALDVLDADVPLMLEHLGGEEEYAKAAAHIRAVAIAEGLEV